MPYDPSLPVNGSVITAAELRGQFQGLHDEIAAIPVGPQGPPGPEGPAFGSANVDTVTTLPPGVAASAGAFLIGNVLHFTFGLPQGADGIQGPPGEVTQAQLSNDLVNNANATFNTIMPLTSNNSNAVTELVLAPGNPPTQADVAAVVAKLNELILALRR